MSESKQYIGLGRNCMLVSNYFRKQILIKHTYLKAIENSSSSHSTIFTAAKDALLGKSSLPPTTPQQMFSDNTVWFCWKTFIKKLKRDSKVQRPLDTKF